MKVFDSLYCGGLIFEDTANGPGIRTSIFISGCANKCPKCFNKELWDPNHGIRFTEKVFNKIMKSLKTPYVKGITLLGGDPLYDKNVVGVSMFIDEFKHYLRNNNMQDKDHIIIYTGYQLEKLCHRMSHRQYLMNILRKSDILIDGKYIDKLKSPELKFRGSSNQRIIDLKKSFKEDKVVIIPEEEI